MIEPFFIKSFFIIVLIIYITVFIVPIIILQRRGIDAKGSSAQYSFLAKTCLIFSILWMVIIVLYVFFEEMMGYFLPFLFLTRDFFIISGMVIIGIGFIFEILGMKKLGSNFRINLPNDTTELVTSGIYRIMRNPIVFSAFLLGIGTFLIIPNLLTLINLIGAIITFNAKVKDEERFLLAVFGREFEKYKENVGRYFPINLKNLCKKN